MSKQMTSPTKKRKWYSQCFKREWLAEAEFKDWLEPDSSDRYSSYCKLCKMSIKHAKRSKLLKHKESNKHMRNSGVTKPRVDTNQSSQEEISESVQISKSEVMFATYFAKHKIPVAYIDHFLKVCKVAFPDSQIAEQLSEKRMKLTYGIQVSMKRFDLLVLGGGSGGLATAKRAAELGVKAAVVEEGRWSGTCPKIEKIVGHAVFIDSQTVEVNGQKYMADHIVIATGGRPVVPDIPGAEHGITSDVFFELGELPSKVVVVGAGHNAVEFAGIFGALGVDTSLFIQGDQVLHTFDEMISRTVTENLETGGVKVIKRTQVSDVVKEADATLTLYTNSGVIYRVNRLVWALGRIPNSDSIGLDRAGVKVDKDQNIEVDQYLNTNVKGIYAMGDVCGKHLLTPATIAAGKRLAERLFDNKEQMKLDYNSIPTMVFSHPPVGSVGLSEEEAQRKYGHGSLKIYTSNFVPMYYSVQEQRMSCSMKLICVLPDEKVVGLHMVGQGCDDMLQGFSLAIRMGATKAQFDDCVAIHPTSAEEMDFIAKGISFQTVITPPCSFSALLSKVINQSILITPKDI